MDGSSALFIFSIASAIGAGAVVLALLWQHTLAAFDFKAWPAFKPRAAAEAVPSPGEGNPQSSEGVPEGSETTSGVSQEPEFAGPGLRPRRNLLRSKKESKE